MNAECGDITTGATTNMAPRSGRSAPRPVKEVTESTRERETFKYDPSLYARVRFNDTGTPIPSAELFSSGDSVLTGLAQLGAYQTGAERAFISLFDTSHQYVIAEAVPTMSLSPFLPSNECTAPLALCGVAIPRSHGTCEHVLYLSSPGDIGIDAEHPLSLVPNLAADSRFNTRPYCQFGEAGQFYAAVPIRTHRGINIGSYCVMSTKMPKDWNDDSPNRLRDVSRAIMGHLEATRSEYVVSRNERLSRGVRSFLEGEASLVHGLGDTISTTTGTASTSKPEPQAGAQDLSLVLEKPPLLSPEILSSPQATPERTTEAASKLAPTADGNARRLPKPRHPAVKTSRTSCEKESGPENGRRPADSVFSRVSSIMRESFEVEGCLFLDVSVGSGASRRQSLQSPVDEHLTADYPSSTSSSDGNSAKVNEDSNAMCKILGFSTTQASSTDPTAELDDNVGMLPKRTLARFLRKYPNGRLFNFDAVGDLQSSDSSDSEDAYEKPKAPGSIGFASNTQGRVQRQTQKEGALIQKAFPGARSVAFIPVWDAKRERWFAGGFVYTLVPTRVLTLEGDMSFFKAFVNLAATEALNHEVRRADQAKSDALGSLSHELRTPLHGILLGTELLSDTDLDVLQGNLTHTIETCCHTLMDTIDHLLDYSKVNDLASKRKRVADKAGPKQNNWSDQDGKSELFSDVQLDALVEDVADSMYAGHTFKQFSGIPSNPGNGKTAHRTRQKDSMMTDKWQHNPGASNVSVHLSIDTASSWMFRLEAGAVRRIVMNLFGNALKYTASGNIWVSLTQEKPPASRRTTERLVKLVVKDTGKGISDDFLQHELFKPFSQENELAPGTGLGLSLVKTIVTGLNGRISVESQVGIGSTFTVILPLEPSNQPLDSLAAMPEDSEVFQEHTRELKGLRVRLCGFETAGASVQSSGINGRAVLESTCRDWLHLDVSTVENTQDVAPDLMLWPHDGLPGDPEALAQLCHSPHIIICNDSLTAYRRSSEYDSAGYHGVFEFISQPIGPRKLARSMQLAYKRWTGLTQAASPPRPLTLSRAGSSYAAVPPTIGTTQGPGSPLRTFNGLSIQPISSPQGDAIVQAATSYFPPAEQIQHDSTSENEEVHQGDVHLLVDDNHINLKVLSAYMTKLQLPHVAVVNGQEAVDTYTEDPTRFAAVLMDLSMPVMDGLEATRHIRAHELKHKLRPVKVLALTGLASERTHREAFESGVDVFLTKPVRLQHLREHLGLIPAQENGG